MLTIINTIENASHLISSDGAFGIMQRAEPREKEIHNRTDQIRSVKRDRASVGGLIALR